MSDLRALARQAIFNLKPYVPGKPVEEVERELGITGVVKMASNENPLGVSPLAREALQKAFHKVNFYPDSNCFYLKKELAERLGCTEENLIFGNGSDELLKMLAETFINPGDEVIFAHPSFSEYEFVSTIFSANCLKVPVGQDFVLDMEAFRQNISPKTKMVFLCNPNNPTGAIVTKQEVDAFLDNIPESVLVVLDEAYYEYVTHPDYPDALKYIKEERNVIALRTFSKIYGLAGLRIGYGIASSEIIAYLNRVREPFNVNLLAQIAARAALNDDNHVKSSRELVLKEKDYFYREFKKLGLSYVPTETNFIFVDTGKDAREVFAALLKEGVIIRSGDIFGYPTHIRVTIGLPEENERLINALQKVLA